MWCYVRYFCTIFILFILRFMQIIMNGYDVNFISCNLIKYLKSMTDFCWDFLDELHFIVSVLHIAYTVGIFIFVK